MRSLGVDVANKGSDKSSLCTKDNNIILPFKTYDHNDTVTLSDEIEYLHKLNPYDVIVIDCDGLGVGVYDVLNHRGLPVIEFRGNYQAKNPDEYFNARSEAYFLVRDRLNPDIRINPIPLIICPDEDLIHELTSLQWAIQARGKKKIESKDDFRKRIGRSPDKADSLIYACYPDVEQREPRFFGQGVQIWTLGGDSKWKTRD